MPIDGTYVRLREERDSDVALLMKLRNDLDTQGYSKTLPPDHTLPMLKKRFDEREFAFERNEGRFIIELIEDNEPIGSIGYYNLEPRFSVVIGIMIDKDYWSAGLAFDAQEALLEFIFQELGVRVVRLWTTSGNERAIKLAKRSGFIISVRQRGAIYKNGILCDNLTMDLLREEYFNTHPNLEDALPLVTAY